MAISKRALAKLSVDDLKALIKAKRKLDKVGPLLKKRDGLAKQLAKLEKKIAKLQGGAAAKRGPGRPPKAAARRGPGRPPKAAARRGPGRPPKAAKNVGKAKRRLSPSGRARIAAAQKRRWAEFRAARKKAGEAKG